MSPAPANSIYASRRGGVCECPVRSIVHSLGRLSTKWLDQDYVFRRRAVQRLVRSSGFSERMAQTMLDALFRELTEAKLRTLLRSELRDPKMLDDFRCVPGALQMVRARGPESITHIFSSNVPNASILSIVLGMLLKSRNVCKLSSRDGGFLKIYLASLKTVDRALWRTNRLIHPRDRKSLTAYLNKTDLVVAYGSDESLEEIRKSVPTGTPLFAYGHRISTGFFAREAMTRKKLQILAVSAARDVWMADQRGCLSPVSLYVQKGGEVLPFEFAERLAEELAKLQKKDGIPPKRDLMDVAAYRAQNRHLLEKIKGNRSGFWQSQPRGIWAVSYEENLRPVLAGGAQHITVKGFKDPGKVFSALTPVKKYLQCVSLECAPKERLILAEKISALGVNRICRAGSMQTPPVTWHHDGYPNLANWVYWTDLEE